MPRPEIADETETEPVPPRAEDEARAVADTVRRAVKQYLATTAV